MDIAAGDVEVLDTEFNGAPLEGNNVRVATSLEALGSLRISVQQERVTAQEFVRMHRKLTPDMSRVATQKLADGWLVSFQYDSERAYAVAAVRKIASRWIRCYAQPESAAASAIAKDACLSLRADAASSQPARQPNRVDRKALLGKWSLDDDEMSAVIEFKTGGRLTMKVHKQSMTRSGVGSGTYEWIDDSTLRFGFVLDRVPKVSTLKIVELTRQRLSAIDKLGTTMTLQRAR